MKTQCYWITGPWPGKLAIVPRPRGGDWLADEVKAWRQAGLDVIVSALLPVETAEFALEDEGNLCRAAGIEFVSFPIPDRQTPASPEKTLELARKLADRLTAGKNVAVHCRQSIGRSSLIAACVLLTAGVDLDEALQRIGAARGCPVPETAEQVRWLKAAKILHHRSRGVEWDTESLSV